jgi:hypothetical protein
MADTRYGIVMHMLIKRYITAEQKKLEEFAVTEDDIAEVRHDISSFRFELLDLFRKNKFIVPEGKDLTGMFTSLIILQTNFDLKRLGVQTTLLYVSYIQPVKIFDLQ